MAVDGRFSLIQTPQALPGICAGCGKAKCEQGFVDTDLQFEFYGAVIFCAECVLDMASKLGLISPEAAEYLQNKVTELETEAATQREALLLLEAALDGIQTARDLLNPGIVSPESTGIIQSEDAPIPSFSEIPDSNSMASSTKSIVDPRNPKIDDNSGEQDPVGIPEPATSELADSASIGLNL